MFRVTTGNTCAIHKVGFSGHDASDVFIAEGFLALQSHLHMCWSEVLVHRDKGINSVLLKAEMGTPEKKTVADEGQVVVCP
jgi:hypothetical protein